MIPGITFGTKHSYKDFGLILSKKEISLPKPKVESISITGRDGDIDLTAALGDDVRFENRQLKFTFSIKDARMYWAKALSQLSNYLHGQKMRIILDADREFYYFGRCTVDQFSSDKAIGTIVVLCDVEPYKIEVNGTYEPWLWDPFSFVDGIIHITEVTVSGSKTVNLINLRKVVSPTFICSATGMTATFDGTTYNMNKGENHMYGIRLKEGDNNVTFTGNGTIQIRYKGGTL